MAQTSTRQRLIYCLVAAVFIAVIALVTMNYLQSKGVQKVPVKSMAYWQVADAPLGFPLPSTGEAPPFDPRFIQLTAFERASIPTATHMSAPMGSEHAALTYNAQPFWSDNTQRGGHHTGDDINGIGGMNTDLGDPVYAIASGLVIYRGEPSPGWGKTLILAHRNPEGQILLSMYAHLDQSHAPLGRLIPIGGTIGTVGTANHNYPAHLHLEMRDSTGIHIGRGYTSHPGESLNPEKTILSHQNTHQAHLHTPPLAILLKERLIQRSKSLIIKHQSAATK